MRNKELFRTCMIVVATAAALAFSATVWAENKTPGGWVRAEGVVMGMVKMTPDDGGKPTLRLSIQEDSGDVLTIQACDRIASNEQGPGFAVGDRVRAVGTMKQMDGLAILESCDIRILSAQADAGAPPAPPVTYVQTYPTDTLVVGYPYPFGFYPSFSPWASPFVFLPGPFFHSRFFFGRERFDRDDRNFGFRGSDGVRFHQSGTWRGSSGTWARPWTTELAPRTVAPRTMMPRTFGPAVPHHAWSPSWSGHIAPTRPIAPMRPVAPSMHGMGPGLRLRH